MPKLFFNLSITLAFIILILFFSVSFSNAGVLVDSRMGHQKDSGYKSERFAVDVVPGMVIRPERRCSNDGGRSNNHRRDGYTGLQRKDRIGPDAWERPFVDPWGRKSINPSHWDKPVYESEKRHRRYGTCERPNHHRGFNRGITGGFRGLRGGIHR